MLKAKVSRPKISTNSQNITNLNDKTIPSSDTCSYGNGNHDGNQSLTIFHQNIHGMKGKIDDLMLSITAEIPHVICLSEHHLREDEIVAAHIPNCELGAKYCRSYLSVGESAYIYIKI